MPSFHESYAHLSDGRPVYYFEEGEGPPLLYVHMGTGSADNARGMFEILRDRFHCVALDRVGYHRSGWLDRETTLEEQAEGISAVHNACAPEPAWVFGHSAGGVCALAYAIKHPERVRGLVLMEPPLLAAFRADQRPPAATAQMEAVAPLFRSGRIREGIAQFIGTMDPKLAPDALDERAASILSSDRRRFWEAHARECTPVVAWCPTREEWILLSQPALIMEGDRTAEFLRPTAAKVAELLPNGELATLAGLSHGAPMAAPAVVAQTIIEFIDRVEAAESGDDKTLWKEVGTSRADLAASCIAAAM